MAGFLNLQQDRAELLEDITQFKEHRKKLKTMFYATVTVLSDLQSFNENLSLDIILDVQAQRFISNVVSGKPAFVVMGDPGMRSRIVQEILGEPILPQLKSQTENWRMVVVRHSTKKCISVNMDDFVDIKSTSNNGKPFNLENLRQEITTLNVSELSKGCVEIGLNSPILESNTQVISFPIHKWDPDLFASSLKFVKNELHPFVIFGLNGSLPVSQEIKEKLVILRKRLPYTPVMFVLSETANSSSNALKMENEMISELINLGYLSEDAIFPSDLAKQAQSPDINTVPEPFSLEESGPANPTIYSNFIPLDKFVPGFSHFTSSLTDFFQENATMQISNAAASVHDAHSRSLQNLIYLAHDLARDTQITPQRIQYAREKETALYQQLIALSSQQVSSIKELVVGTVSERQDEIVKEVINMSFRDVEIPDDGVITDQKIIKKCVLQLQDMVYQQLSKFVAEKLVHTISVLRENTLGTLQRTLVNLEESAQVDVPTADTTEAFKQIIDAAYTLEFSERNSFSAIRLFFQRLKQNFKSAPWKQFKVNDAWKEKYARQLIHGLSASRLAKSISQQFKAKVATSHEQFENALRRLEAHHSGRLQQTEEQRREIRKGLTPRMARLSLDSIALRDATLHGYPKISAHRELGRGQYGVVYACQEWAEHKCLAVKTIVPPDEKHWNDLALEFHYTWCLPKNDYIINLLGAVVSEESEGGGSSTVYLIMPRYPRDLHSALKLGLNTVTLMQIARDVVEGIRFLHGQGLLHRDIKLKNVMLDKLNRARLTDLGFCKPEAMMTHTIVGTPIHMAPELFSGNYDLSVDVYAFGILFWYICSNQKDLPVNFSQCGSKDKLWSNVKQGLRPERLPRFTDECWKLMNECWHPEPKSRPLIGVVAEKVEIILAGVKDKFGKQY